MVQQEGGTPTPALNAPDTDQGLDFDTNASSDEVDESHLTTQGAPDVTKPGEVGDRSDDVPSLSPRERAAFRELLTDADLQSAFKEFALGGAQTASDIGLAWRKQGSERKRDEAIYEQGRQKAEQEFELKRQELVQRAAEAENAFALQRKEVEQAEAVARAQRAHQEETNQLELEKARLEAKLRYSNDRIRGIVLYLIVFAIVLMPIIAMFNLRLAPEAFAQYISPITGIAGTVLGYWFGRESRSNE